jgi:carbamoyltransferase
MNIVGISGFNHSIEFKRKHFPSLTSREYRIVQGLDAAAALVNDKGVRGAVAEERFNREKGTNAFPVHAIQYCLQVENLKSSQIDCVAHSFNYQQVQSLFAQDEFLYKQYSEVFAPDIQRQLLHAHFPEVQWEGKFVAVSHHLAHAASTFYLSGFEEALILISDGMGEINSTTAFLGTRSGIEVVREIPSLHSLGVLYSVVTHYLGFLFNQDEYKVMGLAPYGDPNRYFDAIQQFIYFKDNGTYSIPLLVKHATWEDRETYRGMVDVLIEEFGPAREPESELTQDHKDLAAGLQAVLQACQLHLLRNLKTETHQTNLCMAGGVALNCTANGVIKRSRLFKHLFIQPAAGDDGAALGAALYVYKQHHPERQFPRLIAPYWGPQFDESHFAQCVSKATECVGTEYESFEHLAREIAKRLASGQVVAWFQGRMEFGPRALGNRSILADPRLPHMRDHLNRLIKKREEFRPFAPAVCREAVSKYFDIAPGDEETFAHMLVVSYVRDKYREQLPAVTHVDGSARVQVVSRENNTSFWQLIHEFGKLTGISVVLNTSFNVRGQPIVCTPQEALNTFVESDLDALVLGRHVLVRKNGKQNGTPVSHPS